MKEAVDLTSERTQDPISKHLSNLATTNAVDLSVCGWEAAKGRSEMRRADQLDC